MPHKRAGIAFRVLREAPATEALGPQGEHVAALISGVFTITRSATERLALARAATWYAALDAVRAAARDATRDATRAATRDATWDAALGLLVRDLITTEQYDALTRPWRTAIGPIHPDDPELG